MREETEGNECEGFGVTQVLAQMLEKLFALGVQLELGSALDGLVCRSARLKALQRGGSTQRDGGEGRVQNVAAVCGIQYAQHAIQFGCQVGMLAAGEVSDCRMLDRKRVIWEGGEETQL
eukprot:61784-Rhodomonas_salina.3